MKTMIVALLVLFVAGGEVANAQIHRRKVIVHHRRVIVHHRPHHVIVRHR